MEKKDPMAYLIARKTILTEKNNDWKKEAYDKLYEDYKASNHAKSRYRDLYKKKEMVNIHLTSRNRYLFRQLEALKIRIDKILRTEKNMR
jgi:hypothetical protein